MANKKNFSPEIQEKTRRTPTKDYKVRGWIIVVCEGEKTEPNYFKSFPQKNGVSVVTVGGKGSPSQVVAAAEKLLKNAKKYPDDAVEVWAVFDKDDFSNFKKAIDTAQSKGIRCAWSNEAFELWFLYHFENPTSAISRDKYKKKIEDYVQKGAKKQKLSQYQKFSYQKNDKNIRHTLLACGGNEENDIKWAEKQAKEQVKFHYKDWDKHNPCTMVYLLVKQLLGKDDEFDRKITKSM